MTIQKDITTIAAMQKSMDFKWIRMNFPECVAPELRRSDYKWNVKWCAYADWD